MLQGVLDLGRGGTFQSRTERDIVVRTSLARLEQLDIGDQALYFGRIDRFPDPGDDDGGPRCWASPSTSAGWPSPDRTTNRWWSTGGPRWPSPSTGPPASTRRAWPAAGTWPCGAAACSGWRTSTSPIPMGRPVPRCRPAVPAAHRPVTAGERLLSDGHGARRPRCAAVGPGPGPHRPDGRHHRHHPARAGRDHPLAPDRRPGRPGWPGHRQDGGGAAPGGLPPLHPPLPAGAPGRPGGRAQPVVPALHRAGAARRWARPGSACRRWPGWCPRSGCAGSTTPTSPSSRATSGWSGCWPEPCGPASARSAATSRSPSAPASCACGPGPTEDIVGMARRRPGTHNVRRRFVEAHVLRVLSDEYRARLGPERPRWTTTTLRPPRSRRTWPSGCAGSPKWPRRWTGCGPASPPTSSCTTSWAPARCWPPPARGS